MNGKPAALMGATPGGALADEPTQKHLAKMLAAFAEWIRRLRAA